MDLNLIMCQPALVLIIRYRYSTSRTFLAWRGMLTHTSHPHPWLRACWGASNSLADFIMHEYLHKYFENIKKTRQFFFIRNMRPLSIREAPPAGGCGGSFHRLCSGRRHSPPPKFLWLRHCRLPAPCTNYVYPD